MYEFNIADDLKICTPENLSLMTPFIMAEREAWFENEIDFLKRLIEPGVNVIDVGANFGAYTLPLCQLVGPEGRVWSFEPSIIPTEHLTESLQRNGFANCRLTAAALSNRTGTGQMSISGNSELNSLHPKLIEGQKHHEVELTTLDAFACDNDLGKIAFLKINAEGEEVKIFQAAQQFLSAQSPVVMFECMHDNRPNFSLFSILGSYGYQNYCYAPALDALVEQGNLDADTTPLNLFACRRDDALALAKRGLLVMPEYSIRGLRYPREDSLFHLGALEHLASHANAAALIPTHGEENADLYHKALACYAATCDPQYSLIQRYAYLASAHKMLAAMISQTRASVEQILSFVRAAADLGFRHQAARIALETLKLHFSPDKERLTAEHYYLPPCISFDTVNPGDQFHQWAFCGLLETYLTQNDSVYFLKEKDLADLLERASDMPFFSAGLERRRRLLALREGRTLPLPPAEKDQLTVARPDHRNPQFWRTLAATQKQPGSRRFTESRAGYC